MILILTKDIVSVDEWDYFYRALNQCKNPSDFACLPSEYIEAIITIDDNITTTVLYQNSDGNYVEKWEKDEKEDKADTGTDKKIG